MSAQGKRIGRRLAKRHGFKFLLDPFHFHISCDREGVMRNVLGGQGVMQWVLSSDREFGVQMGFRDKLERVEVGSCFGACDVLKWKHWHVFYDDSLRSCGIIVWIYNGHGEDKTEM